MAKKMKNCNNIDMAQISEILDALSLDSQQRTLAQAYLLGEADESALGQMPHCDLSQVTLEVPAQTAKNLFGLFMVQQKQEQARRLFELLFAIGRATCYPMIQKDIFTAKEGAIACDPVKKITIYLYAQFYNNWTNSLFGGDIKSFLQMAENQPEYFKTVLNCIEENERAFISTFTQHTRKERRDHLRLVLLMAYFTAKYNNSEETAVPPEEDSGDMPEIAIASEDIPLMKQYEDIILSRFGDLFQNQMEASALAKIVTAIVENQITPKIKELAASVCVDKVLLHLYGGLAYLNYNLSVTLKNIVKICLETKICMLSATNTSCWDNRDMLDVIQYISSLLFMDIEIRGTNYDKVLGIDSKRLIQWAAFKQYSAILDQQFWTNRECFLRAMDEPDWDWQFIYKVARQKSEYDMKKELHACNFLYQIAAQQDPPLYQQFLAEHRQQNINKERLILMLLHDVEEYRELVENYLRGAAAVDTLYPIAEQLMENSYDFYTETDLLMTYWAQYQDEPFHRRCEAYLLLIRSDYFIVRDISVSEDIEDGISSVKVQKLLENLDQEGLAIAFQFKGLMMLVEEWGRDEDWIMSLVESAVGSFSEYLHQKKEETWKAFTTGNAFGRFFALRVLLECPEEYKAEILYFTKDSSKKVQGELLGFLYGQKSWEEDIKQLLNAKNAKQRELAAKVMCHWQGNGM